MQPAETAEAVARNSYGKLIAFLAARTRDVAAAEDAPSEAFAAALADWPRNGCPQNPEAWLLTVARRKIIDAARRRATSEAAQIPVANEPVNENIPDRRLALMFACAHPAIDQAVRAPLILQTVPGLDAKRIASAFLMSPDAIGKRLGRAKHKIRQAGIPFRIPEPEELPARLDAVLEAIYAAFTEGWTDPTGATHLTGESLFLARLTIELLPSEPEARGLLALMLHAEARRKARLNDAGEYVPLADQDHNRWNWSMIAEAEALLRPPVTLGRYQLEAAIQSAHVHRQRTGRANWTEIVQLYDALYAVTNSPVVRVNRALAVAEVQGAEQALQEIADLSCDPRLTEYQPYWAARAELLSRTGAHHNETRHAYQIAIGLERNPAVRYFLSSRSSIIS